MFPDWQFFNVSKVHGMPNAPIKCTPKNVDTLSTSLFQHSDKTLCLNPRP
ncbi:hypothetical protein BBKW_1380 [Bifidobacterium catenulatum subsp. kashiwanohense JCM 15439 = DSM 21854]|nr:hypothetical protein BBKW_1380 [Bifidobacterium catenulatum subsp. kashiwanohense JCM 15439 = DSM 21854]